MDKKFKKKHGGKLKCAFCEEHVNKNIKFSYIVLN